MRKAAPLAALAATALTLSACAQSERDDSGSGGDAEGTFTFGAAGAPADSWASMIRFTVLWVVPQIAAAPR